MNSIQYISNANIDKSKWDDCIMNSYNGLIYSTAVYLDKMADNWDAIIMNDYDAVLPIPWRKKWGIHYIYPPAFTQQLGLSCINKQHENLFDQFINSIPKKFRYVEMNLNSTNHAANFSLFQRKNYLLGLTEDYGHLRKKYSRSANRNISNAKNNGITIIENAAIADVVRLHRERFEDEIGFNEKDYTNFLSLVDTFSTAGSCYCIGALSGNGSLIAGSIYLFYKEKLYFLINGNTAESLKIGATHLLMDHTINKFSGKNFVLDFEGSDHSSFARFYEQYGATQETYQFLTINRLPWPIKLFKTGKSSPVSKL